MSISMQRRVFYTITLFLIVCAGLAGAADRGVLIREATLYVNPDLNAAKVGVAGRGREIAIFERSHEWAKVFANVDQEKDVTGWLLDKGIIFASTPNGDRILFGAAAEAEEEASRSHGRRGAEKDAMRLYARMAEYFPNSPLAAEALYRAGDIRWQIEYADVMSLPSAKEQDPDMRSKIDEEIMHQVIKKYPGTKWADLAAYHLLDNKVCGDWQAQSKCPERETELFEKYVREHPKSPKAAEALYKSAFRQAALIEIYKTENQPSRSTAAATRAHALAKRVPSEYPDSDWASRALTLEYEIEQKIPTYGNQTD